MLDLQGFSEFVCGERGIRTPGTSRYDGFQDRCNRPLYHLSLQDDQLGFLKRLQRYDYFFFLPNIYETFFDFSLKSGYTYVCRAVYRGCLYKNGATAVAPNLDNLKSNTMKNTLQR